MDPNASPRARDRRRTSRFRRTARDWSSRRRSSRTRALGVPVRFRRGRITGQTLSDHAGQHRRSRFRRPRRRLEGRVPHRSRRPQRIVGTIDWRGTRTSSAVRARTGRFAKPRWSPDGARLAFSRYATRDHLLAVALLNADGSGERVLTRPDHVEMQGSDWSRDGQAILGSCRFSSSERYATCLVPVSTPDEDGEPTVRVIASDPKRNLFNQRFSPDQRWITFLAHDLLYASTSTVYVIPAGGGAWRAITDGTSFDDKPRWGPDGRILYFVSNRSGVANVWGRRFNPSSGTPTGEPFPVTSFGSAQFQLTPRRVQMDIAVTATTLLLPMTRIAQRDLDARSDRSVKARRIRNSCGLRSEIRRQNVVAALPFPAPLGRSAPIDLANGGGVFALCGMLTRSKDAIAA